MRFEGFSPTFIFSFSFFFLLQWEHGRAGVEESRLANTVSSEGSRRADSERSSMSSGARLGCEFPTPGGPRRRLVGRVVFPSLPPNTSRLLCQEYACPLLTSDPPPPPPTPSPAESSRSERLSGGGRRSAARSGTGRDLNFFFSCIYKYVKVSEPKCVSKREG